ncbi:hypothetical protein K438DRAFT_1766201 [Mycena galopus ATCC 62051]|nr:hypothetical protein K438DRAFT_1766201 [Mycena galopus ATCC 62051]
MANSDYHTRRKYRAQVAEHSENYCNRKLQEDLVARCSAEVVKWQASQPLRTEERKCLLKQLQHDSTLPKMSPHLALQPKQRNASDKDVNMEDSDTSQEMETPYLPLDKPFFPGRITQWIDHPGGHFFPDCKKCGSTDCPGCMCICKYSTVLVEHGGHVRKNFPITCCFFAIIHEDWMSVVTSENTIVCMLNAYPKARIFRTTTWSRFKDLWNQDCTEYHEHPNAVLTPASKLPSLRNKGELPTEDTHNRETMVKENIRHNLGCTRPPLVPMDAERADTMFTLVLGPHVAAPSRTELVHLIVISGPGSQYAASALSPSELTGAAEIAARGAAVDPSPSELIVGFSAMTMNSHAHTRPSLPPLPIEPIEGKSEDREQTERNWASTSAPVMYAVSGHKRSFDHTVAVFKATPSAELAYSCNAEEPLCFLEDEDDVLPELVNEGSE